MQPNMMDFGSGPGGAMISGKWINKRTGKVINVRDSFIDDMNKMTLMTDQGQMSMDEFTKYYVQASDEVYDMSGKVIDTKAVTAEEIGVETDLVADPIEFNPTISQPIQPVSKPVNNYELIDKIFKKTGWEPELVIEMKSNQEFPEKELSMLIDYFDVKIEDISAYIGKYLVNEDLLSKEISKYLNGKLGKSTISVKSTSKKSTK